MSTEPHPQDARLLAQLRGMWERSDPPPPGLTERVSFVIALDDLDAEVMRLRDEVLQPVGARGTERVRTVTFGGTDVTVMLSIGPEQRGSHRIDGWVAPAAEVSVELRTAEGRQLETVTDQQGRFVFDDVRSGLFQLVLHPTPASTAVLDHDLVAPALQV